MRLIIARTGGMDGGLYWVCIIYIRPRKFFRGGVFGGFLLLIRAFVA